MLEVLRWRSAFPRSCAGFLAMARAAFIEAARCRAVGTRAAPRFLAIVVIVACCWGITGPLLADESQTARALLDKAIAAAGGEAQLQKHKAATWKAKGTYFGFSKGIKFSGSWAVQSPERARIAIEGEMNGTRYTRILVIDGAKGWAKRNDEVDELDQESLREEKNRLHANWVSSLAPLSDKAFELSLLEERKIGGQLASGLVVVHAGYPDVRLYFAKKSGLLLRSETTIHDPHYTTKTTQAVEYSDYQEIEGVKHAMRIVVSWDDKKCAEAILSEFTPRTKLADKVFAKP